MSDPKRLSEGAEIGRLSRGTRGLMLGSALGDAFGTGTPVSDGAGQLRTGVATQLALFTVEGLIRASVRQSARGICSPPSLVWHALARWAYGRGVAAPALYDQWRSGGLDAWPDGWLAGVPLLKEPRGSAPSTLAALRRGTQGTRQHPTTKSVHQHGLIRALAVGALGTAPRQTFQLAADVAALTQGAPDGYLPAAHGALFAAALLHADDVSSGIAQAVRAIADVDPDSGHADLYADAAADGERAPGDVAVLTRHGEIGTAVDVLRSAIYVVASFPSPSQFREAVAFAASSAGGGVATVAGALLGALHGVDSLPVDLVSRLDLAWVADTLARDLVAEVYEAPGGHETMIKASDGAYQVAWVEGSDPNWLNRYPAW